MRRIEAEGVVLATGRFTGGGIVEREGVVREALLGLPLFDDGGRRIDGDAARRHVRPGYDTAQPLFTAGLRSDEHLRPLDPRGRPALLNLVAAGEILGGFEPALIRTGLGLALLSGIRAGRSLVELTAGVAP